MGYGEASTYPATSSHGRLSTPHIARLAANGLTFTSGYAGEAVCAPSRGSLMTGKHTGHATIRGNKNYKGHDFPLSASDITIAQLLQQSGYDTALFGKWGLGYNGSTGAPWAKGFDTYLGQLGQAECHNYYPTSVWSYEPGSFPQAVPIAANKGASRARCMSPGGGCVYVPELFVNKSIEWLGQRDSVKPFFLYLALTPPHAGGYTGTLESGAPVPSDGAYASKGWPDVEKDHAAMVTYAVDSYVGQIVSALSSKGLGNNTLIIFASDNGPHNEGGHDYRFFNSAGPLRGFKRSLYEGGIRVPVIAKWPSVIKPGLKTEAPIAFWDFLPTFANLAGVTELPKGLDGVDISPLFAQQPLPERAFYWEFCTQNSWGHAIRKGDWKAVSFAYDSPMELYNVTQDIGESHNVAARFPNIVKALAKEATSMHTDDPNWPIVNCVSS